MSPVVQKLAWHVCVTSQEQKQLCGGEVTEESQRGEEQTGWPCPSRWGSRDFWGRQNRGGQGAPCWLAALVLHPFQLASHCKPFLDRHHSAPPFGSTPQGIHALHAPRRLLHLPTPGWNSPKACSTALPQCTSSPSPVKCAHFVSHPLET